MAHEVEKMIFTGATPWHGLGTHLDVAPASTEEAIRLAGLDWEIALQQLMLADGRTVERNAVIRQSDGAILGTVGMGWEPIQNVKAFAPFDPFLQAGLATIETAGSLRGGKRVWMLAKVNRPDSVIVAKADDRVAKYLLVAVGHDGTLAFRLGYTPTRVVCMNTLSVALSEGENTHIRIPHLSGATKAIEAVTKTIDGVDAKFEKAAEIFRALAGVKIHNAGELRSYVDAVFSPNKGKQDDTGAETFSDLLSRPAAISTSGALDPNSGNMTKETKSRVYEEIAVLFEQGKGNNLPGVKGTAWAAYNAVTEQLTWHRGRSQDARLEAVWLRDSGVAARALPAAVDQFLS